MDIINNTYSFITMPVFFLLVLFIVGIALGLIASYVVTRLLEKYLPSTNQFNLLHLIKQLRPVLYFFMPLLMLNIILPIFGFQTGDYTLLDGMMRALLVAAITTLTIQIINFAEEYLYKKFDVSVKDNLRARKVRTQIKFIKKFILTLVIIIAVSLVLMSFESARRIGAGILTSAGILTGIITFAAQNSISNIWAGLQVAFTQPIRIDDVLIVENENGRVEEITLSYVVFKTWDKRRLILPIKYFTEKPFQNWTYSTADQIGTIFLYVDYSLPVEDIRQQLKGFLQDHPLWDKEVMALQVTEADEHVMQLRILVSAKDPGSVFNLRCDIREQLILYIQKNYPQCLPKSRVEEKKVENFI